MKTSPPRTYEFGDFRLDLEEQMLFSPHGSPVQLTPRVFETLRYLVEHAGHISDKQALMDAVWPDCIVEENNLAQNISTLRRLLADKNGTPRYIATVPGRGYRFVAEVRTVENGATQTVEPARPRAEDSSQATDDRAARGRAGSTRTVFAGIAIVILLACAAAYFWPRRADLPPVPEKSIAVLPFANLSSDPDTIYFAEGMKDEILTRLSKIAALKVISRTSTLKFADKPRNVREIAQRLGVAHILEGSVQKSGETVRVTVQLIHAPSDTHLWAESYDRKLIDILQVESEIARRIARALEATLTGTETRALAAPTTANFQAYEAYLQGRYFWNKRTPEGYREAVAHLRRAIELDSGYAQAYAGLADAEYFLSGGAAPDETAHKTRTLLQKALALDETLADAHASLGLLAMNHDWDWAKAETKFKRAIELNPNYGTAHHWYGEFLAYMGRFDEAIAEINRARELDPLSLIIKTDVGLVYLMGRRYPEAVAQFEAALKLDSDFHLAHGFLGLTYSLQARHEDAAAELRNIKDFENTPLYLSLLGYVYGAAGNHPEAKRVVHQLEALASRTYVSPVFMAAVHAGMGENDQAFHWFERVFAERAASGTVSLKVNPVFDRLRSDPRYTSLLRRANFIP